MKLYIDGDALPNILKPILSRAIEKLNIDTYVISNKKIKIDGSPFINYIVVSQGADEADDHIIEMIKSSDLVITADIPLADRTISKNAHAIDHRGEMYTKNNIKQFLAIRDLMQSIRDSGEMTKGPKPFSQKDAQNFANSFNKFLQKYL